MDSTVLLVFAAQILVTSGKCWEAPESAIALKKKRSKDDIILSTQGLWAQSGTADYAQLTLNPKLSKEVECGWR